MLKVLELFGGIGACSNALSQLDIDYEIVDYVEIDKYAVNSFNAIHNTQFNTQDICKWNKTIDVGLIMHGSPCQDFSTAGLQAGGDKGSGTRSSLMYETIRIIEKLKPKFVIWENVKNLLSERHRYNFDNYLAALENIGYNSYYKVLNAKNYGIPQNRERVFTISVRKDLNKKFIFPEKQNLLLRLGDLLEREVEEKYYLSSKLVESYTNKVKEQKQKGNGFKFKPLDDTAEYAKTITSKSGSRMTDNYIKENPKILQLPRGNNKGGVKEREVCPTITSAAFKDNNFIVEEKNLKQELCDKLIAQGKVIENDVIRHSYTKSRMAGEMKDIKQNNISPTLDTRCDCLGVVVNSDNAYLRIRKLTPKECWRLMGFNDLDFEKAQKVNSNAQLYKQAGNSIVVNVLKAILTNLLEEKNDNS